MSLGFGTALGVGSTDAVTTAYTQSGSNERSYSAWFFLSSTSQISCIFKKSTGTSQSENLIWNFGLGSGALDFARENSAGTQTAKHRLAIPTASTWHHVVVTHNQSSGTLTAPTAWLDGVQQSVTVETALTLGTTAANNTDPFVIGNRGDGAQGWVGMLAHVAIWDGALLSALEAVALFQGVSAFQIRPASLVAYAPLFGKGPIDYRNRGGTVTGTKIGATSSRSAFLPMMGGRAL